MKDFDEDRVASRRPLADRTFRIGGEVFVARAENHPDVLAGYDRITDETGVGETLQIVDEILEQMLEPDNDSVARYRSVRARTDDIVTVDDLLKLVAWLMTLQTAPASAAAQEPPRRAPVVSAVPAPSVPPAEVAAG